jgi:hypothetical protein
MSRPLIDPLHDPYVYSRYRLASDLRSQISGIVKDFKLQAQASRWPSFVSQIDSHRAVRTTARAGPTSRTLSTGANPQGCRSGRSVLSADDAEHAVSSVNTPLCSNPLFPSAVGVITSSFIHPPVRGWSVSTLSISSPQSPPFR